MELEQLRFFIQVAEHGSFSRAAVVLGVTQPFLSRQVRRLEVELRRNLFYRHGRGIWLTEEGERFMATARSVLHQLTLAAVVTQGADDELTGRFALGLTPSLAHSLTVPLVRAFTARFPRARLSIVEGLSRGLHGQLVAERLDAAVLHDQAASSLVQVEPLCGQRLCLLARRGEWSAARPQLPFSELGGLPLIFPSTPHPLRAIVEEQARRAGMELDVVYDIDGVETLLELVQEGFGCAVASAHVVQSARWSATLVALPITEPEMVTQLLLATSVRRPATALHRLTLELLRQVLGRTLGMG
jgi:LysR family nitrogen assimilation transcriptional regulator